MDRTLTYLKQFRCRRMIYLPVTLFTSRSPFTFLRVYTFYQILFALSSRSPAFFFGVSLECFFFRLPPWLAGSPICL